MLYANVFFEYSILVKQKISVDRSLDPCVKIGRCLKKYSKLTTKLNL